MLVFELVLIGVAITLDPLPLTAFILILGSERGLGKGLAFLLGWLACLALIVVGVVVITGGEPLKPQSAPSTAVLVGKLLLGLILVWLGYRQRKRMGRPRTPPSWTQKLDALSVPAAAVIGPFVQPWTLVAAGALAVATAKVSNVWEVLGLVGFCLLGSASLIVMLAYARFRPEAARARLDALKQWIDDHTDQAIVIGCLVVGAFLVVQSTYLLATG